MTVYDYIHVTIHDFKTNISRYIRMLERGEARAIVVRRHATAVGLFVPIAADKAQALKNIEPTGGGL